MATSPDSRRQRREAPDAYAMSDMEERHGSSEDTYGENEACGLRPEVWGRNPTTSPLDLYTFRAPPSCVGICAEISTPSGSGQLLRDMRPAAENWYATGGPHHGCKLHEAWYSTEFRDQGEERKEEAPVKN